MVLEIIEITQKLINLFDKYAKNWINGTYVITAKSGESISYNAGPHLFDATRTKLTYEDYLVFIPDNEFSNWIKEYFVGINRKQKVNRLTFVFENKIFVSLNAEWDQTVQDEFEQLLPKSLKGKIRAWYLPIEEGSTSRQPPETNIKAMFKKHVAQLPSQEEAIPLAQLNGKSLQELYQMYDPYIRDTTTSLWDGGLIGIKKDITGQFSGDLALYYYEDEEYRETGRADYEEALLPMVTDRMKSIYEAIQAETKRLHPAITWDALFVSISPDSFAEANFECKGVEVELE